MKVGRSNVERQVYTMFDDLNKTTKEKDIGMVIGDKLQFSDNSAEKVNKANSMIGVIRRTFVHLGLPMFKALYTALVRPHLEYANQVWRPHLLKDITIIENIQQRATKLRPHLKDLSYEEGLKKLDLSIHGQSYHI